MKICSLCKINKPLNEFIKDNRRKNGRGYRCLDCHRLSEYKRANTVNGKISKKKSSLIYYELNSIKLLLKSKNRKIMGAHFINEHKGVPCIDCNLNYPVQCMELDHINFNKIKNVSEMKSMKLENISKEIEKCEIVCAVCHRIRTSNRRIESKNKIVVKFRTMINNIKSVPCHDCNKKFPTVAMDFDHVKGVKLYNISDMWNCSNEIILEELNKCEIVCANCHRIRTQNSFHKDIK
jgi:hypothetical protein